MNLPLYKDAVERRPTRGSDGHAGLWFDKFCDQWRIDRGTWTMAAGNDNPKLHWIKTLTTDKIGDKERIQESASRLARLIERRAGRWSVFTAVWLSLALLVVFLPCWFWRFIRAVLKVFFASQSLFLKIEIFRSFSSASGIFLMVFI